MATQVADTFPDWYWDSYGCEDDDSEEYLPCALCSHDMVSECGIGERDYFVTGQHICVCCSDPDEEAPDAD